ncbi:MAG: hypothetical protein ACLGIV_02005 [Actinomycetes bacterium]
MATTYRFLPWARRGLAAALPDEPAASSSAPPSVPLRAGVVVTATVAGVTGDPTVTTGATLFGPGDVVGLDPAQVVRMSPRPHTTDAEPNYLAAVDLDAPELPWLFTPRGASDRLLPWLVLVVVEDRPGVTVSLPTGAPLPRLRIESGAAAELPDLADSWAWAHVQLVAPTGGAATPQAVADTLGAQPDRNVARLMCPRRLAPGRRWVAALVPAFDAGVVRGLGGTPDGESLAPAWSSPESVTLPVYHHWRFQTGPEGDFEALAQRLRPFEAPATVGYVPMHVGANPPPLRVPAPVDADDPDQRRIDMDGALRATAGSDGTLAQVAATLVDGLATVSRTLADAADGRLDGVVAETDRQPVGPPVYASSHRRRWQVGPSDPVWFRELNLDPRPRVAAGLGAECVRQHQEDIVHAAWQQVGDVLDAEAALQRAALATLLSRAFHRRHLAPMDDERLLTVVGPVAARLPVAGRALTAAVARTSTPDAVLGAGFRRALAPAGRAVQRAARRVGVTGTALRPGLVAALAQGRRDVDATRFERPVLSGFDPAALDGAGDLAGLGLPVQVRREDVRGLASAAQAVTSTQDGTPLELWTTRPDLRDTGMLGTAHLEAARDLAVTVTRALVEQDVRVDVDTALAVSTGALSEALVEGAGRTPGVGLLLEGPTVAGGRVDTAVDVGVLDVDTGGRLVLRTEAGRRNRPVAALDGSLAGADLTAVVARLGPGVLHAVRAADADLPVLTRGGLRPGHASVPSVVRAAPAEARTGLGALRSRPGPARPGLPGLPGAGRPRPTLPGPVVPGPVVEPGPVVVGPAPPPGGRPTVTMPPLVTDAATIGRFELAVTLWRDVSTLTTPEVTATLVPLDLGSVTAAALAHLDPAVAQPLRRDASLRFAGATVGTLTGPFTGADGWWATPAADRVMAYPVLDVPAYRYLAEYDQARFCPGIDAIPPDSVSLLETNPRFIAAFMAGLNHETNSELLWRGYPTDSRGTPFRRFWDRLDGRSDVPPLHTWGAGTLAQQTTDPRGNLVLLVRGDLLRRYPHTVVLAVRADGTRPSRDTADVLEPVFAGQFDPDVSFFGFPLVDTDLTDGDGWFFALMEPVTEPRFGLDETAEPGSGSDALAWPATGVTHGGHLTRTAFPALGLNGAASRADDVAAVLFQKPFALYVHARHLTSPLPVQR